MKLLIGSAALLLMTCLTVQQASADYYGCYKQIYAKGWLRKYEFKGNSYGANTKKHGALTSTVGVMVENLTSTVDPGVTSGEGLSTTQYSSSWGECAAIDMLISRNTREKYIEQNMSELKKQIAMGTGDQVHALGVLSGCRDITFEQWSKELQEHTPELYDANSSAAFSEALDSIVRKNESLAKSCSFDS